jgi:hypothetical protein
VRDAFGFVKKTDLRQKTAQARRLREVPAPELLLVPKSSEISCDSGEAAVVDDDESEPPNKSLTSCNWSAAALNCTRSDGEAFCNADCTVGEDSAEETEADPAPDRSWSTSVTPGFTGAIELIDLLIGRKSKF